MPTSHRRSTRPLTTLAALALGLLASLGAAEAHAAGAVIAPSELTPDGAKSLDAAVAKARADHPDTFASLARVRAELGAIDAQKRGPYAPLGRLLKDLGPDAVPALLEALALDAGRGRAAPVPAGPPDGLTTTAWLAWRVGLVEAVGAHRDAGAAPVLEAILAHPELEAPLLRATAAALGKLGSADAVRLLGKLAEADDARGRAAVYGLGHARTEASAAKLGAELAKLPSGERARTLVHALGDVGSAWAWQAIARAPRGADPKQADATRLTAMQALVGAFVVYGPTTRKEIERALVVVDHPRTAAALASQKRGADAATQAAIDALVARLAKGTRGR